jgi:hypothetical protein
MASFEQAVRRAMAHHPEAESCAADRLAGVVAAGSFAARPVASS